MKRLGTGLVLAVAVALLGLSVWGEGRQAIRPAAADEGPGTGSIAGFAFRVPPFASPRNASQEPGDSAEPRLLLSYSGTAPLGYVPAAGTHIMVPHTSLATTVASDGSFLLANVPLGETRIAFPRFDVTFPVTVIKDVAVRLGQPPVSREDALKAVQRELARLPDPPEEAWIFSPQTPLPPGTTVGSVLSDDDGLPSPLPDYSVARPQWFFYVDPNSHLRSQHPAYFYLVDAENGSVATRDASSWPALNARGYYGRPEVNITSADVVQYPLDVDRTASQPPNPLLELAFGPARRAEDHVPGCTNPKTYALLIEGSDEYPMDHDLANVLQNVLFSARGGLPPLGQALIHQPKDGPGKGTPKKDVLQKFAQICAATTECDTIFIYITAHGGRNGSASLETGDTDKDGAALDQDSLSPADFNVASCRACHWVVIQDSCYSGKAMAGWKAKFDPLTGRKAIVLTATDATHGSSFFNWYNLTKETGAVFTNSMVKFLDTPLGLGFDTSFGLAVKDMGNTYIGSGSAAIRAQNPQIYVRTPAALEAPCVLGATKTPTPTPTGTPAVPPPTFTPTDTPTFTPVPGLSPTPTPTPTYTPVIDQSPTPTPTLGIPPPTPTPTSTPTPTPTSVPPTPTPTLTPTPTAASNCQATGTFPATFVVLIDPAGHAGFIGLSTSMLAVQTSSNQVVVTGSAPQTVTASGPFDAATCTWSGTGTGTIAGFPNVQCQYNSVVTSGRTISGQYVCGTRGELPTGQSITYSFSGTR